MAGVVLSVGEHDQHAGDAAVIGISHKFPTSKMDSIKQRGFAASGEIGDARREVPGVGGEILGDEDTAIESSDKGEVGGAVENPLNKFFGGTFLEREAFFDRGAHIDEEPQA